MRVDQAAQGSARGGEFQTFETRKGCEMHSCTIMRTFVRTSRKINIFTGKQEGRTKKATVTEACNSPLFGEQEQKNGVCRSCAAGWEVHANRFASMAERQRAAGETETKGRNP